MLGNISTHLDIDLHSDNYFEIGRLCELAKRLNLPMPATLGKGLIERNQNALQDAVFRICRVTQLLSLDALSNRHKNITVLNWVEDEKYRRSNSFFKAYILFFGFLSLILLSKIMSNKVVWIKHNLKPHNAHGNAGCHRLTYVWFNLLNIKAVGLE